MWEFLGKSANSNKPHQHWYWGKGIAVFLSGDKTSNGLLTFVQKCSFHLNSKNEQKWKGLSSFRDCYILFVDTCFWSSPYFVLLGKNNRKSISDDGDDRNKYLDILLHRSKQFNRRCSIPLLSVSLHRLSSFYISPRGYMTYRWIGGCCWGFPSIYSLLHTNSCWKLYEGNTAKILYLFHNCDNILGPSLSKINF